MTTEMPVESNNTIATIVESSEGGVTRRVRIDRQVERQEDTIEFKTLWPNNKKPEVTRILLSHTAIGMLKQAISNVENYVPTPKGVDEPVAVIEPKEVQWIVNNLGELGVLIHGQAFFLYKRDSIQYDTYGEVNAYRPVEKREFGETVRAINVMSDERVELVPPESVDWYPLPTPLKKV
jgi:hypothetical protein